VSNDAVTHQSDGPERTDAELIALAAAGNREAFDQLVVRFESPVLSIVRRLKVDNDALVSIEDLAQIAWLAVWRGLPNFRGDSEFLTWVYTIVENASKNARRSRDRRPRAESLLVDPSGQHVPSDVVVDMVAVGDAVAALPEIHRCVFINRAVHDMTWEENIEATAVALGRHVSLWEARSAYQSALAILQRSFGDQ
jgi:RNA polymerase sigma-70 factor, ECF subfamily